MPSAQHPFTPPEKRKRDVMTGPLLPQNPQQAEQGTKARNTEGHEPFGTALPAPCDGTWQGAREKRQRETRTLREREHTDTDRTRGAHRKKMHMHLRKEYQHARASSQTRQTRQPRLCHMRGLSKVLRIISRPALA